MMKLKEKIDSLAQIHEEALRQNDSEEWDYEKQEPAAIGQGSHSYKLGASTISKEWAQKWKAFRESTLNQAIQLSTPVTQELQDLINKQVKELDEWSAEACHL